MKFGVVLPSYGPQAGRMSIVDTALAAERLGFDSAWLTDHLALPESDAERFGHIFESLTTLGYLAASTVTLRLGTSVLVLPQRNPVEVAKQVATLDVLSGGRIILGVGIGWSEGEYGNLGYDFHNRGKRMDEALRVLRTLWRGQRTVSFKGQYYTFEKVVFSPPPVQPGGPVLWVGGNTRAALRRAAYLADGWHPNARSPETLERMLKGTASLLGARPFSVVLRMRVAFNDQPESEYTLAGSPDQVREQLRAYQQAGMTDAVIYFEAGSQGEREQAMRTFAQEVMPAFTN